MLNYFFFFFFHNTNINRLRVGSWSRSRLIKAVEKSDIRAAVRQKTAVVRKNHWNFINIAIEYSTNFVFSYLRKKIPKTRCYFNYHNSLFSLVSPDPENIRLGGNIETRISENGSRPSRCHSFRKIQQKNAIRNLERKRNARGDYSREKCQREKKKEYSRCNNTVTRTSYETPPLSKVSLLIFYVCACVCVFYARAWKPCLFSFSSRPWKLPSRDKMIRVEFNYHYSFFIREKKLSDSNWTFLHRNNLNLTRRNGME